MFDKKENKAMKLLVISSDYPDIIGGVSGYTYNLCKAFVDEGIEVYVLTANDPRIKSDNNPKVLPIIKKWSFFELPKIINTINDINPDFISLQYVPYMYNYYGMPMWVVIFALWLRFKGFKLITTFHEICIVFDLNPKYWIVAIIQRLIAYLLSFASNKIIVSIEYSRKILYPFKNKIVQIPIGSNILPLDVPEDQKNVLRKKIAPNNEIIISTFGKIGHYRRDDILLEAIKKVKESKGGVLIKLLFLGESSKVLKENLSREINQLNLQSTVSFLGYLDVKELYKYLLISNIFVLLNVDIRGGITVKSTSVAAAYAAGLPVIGCKGLITDNFFRDGENVLFVKSLTVDAVADSIMKLVNDTNFRNNLANQAFESYKKELAWDIISNKYKDIFIELSSQY